MRKISKFKQICIKHVTREQLLSNLLDLIIRIKILIVLKLKVVQNIQWFSSKVFFDIVKFAELLLTRKSIENFNM